MTGDLIGRRWKGLAAALLAAVVVSGCATGRSIRAGNAASDSGDLDQAVAHYRAAVEASPKIGRAHV